MARFYGVVGYSETVEIEPGIWEESIIEKPYFGDIIKRSAHYQAADKINDDISIMNDVSIVADPYSIGHFFNIRYVEVFGQKWKVTNVEIRVPRLILSIGGLYNA